LLLYLIQQDGRHEVIILFSNENILMFNEDV